MARYDETIRRQLDERGISEAEFERQLECFHKGFAPLDVVRPCKVGDGIVAILPKAEGELIARYDEAAHEGRFMKFVPASGAASRMFHSLSAALAASSFDDADVKTFMAGLSEFAFGKELMAAAKSKEPQDVLRALLLPEGLNFAALPKGLIPFHRYPAGPRTAFQEQLVEAVRHVTDARRTARIHFTVAPEFRAQIRAHLDASRDGAYNEGVRFELGLSEQHPSTDTVAVDLQNEPVLDDAGRLVFRPGGHGALLTNLDALEGDVVFIKNVDNVAPDHGKHATVRNKTLLGGYLLQLQDQIFEHLKALDAGDDPGEARAFVHEHFGIETDDPRAALHRPLRVCGMVKNQGEPGGGPFWVRDAQGHETLQIVESSQIPEDRKGLMKKGTHFNPVDLVCGVRDYKGRPFALADYVDPETGFISIKSKDGVEHKALERPGLWNGAMARWNTVFVEVPLDTFCPVKTVLDLLRPEHQPLD